ncbi:peptidyl-prolyl cis-trans isomerase CYP59 [Selaginella moellendorffii]|uniref:peptidyl-prolyl cis-trans isomerase CYP59 n=1 Tax=Selaginella moellendorffii TaxID=88036 RepID=UPI000D1CD02E|nr:peptidyl-prolyl cis-trans isomerase CYP59 [Selaginella moellendorffii]|eukprot:XP_002965263.2 peptidyl-prolyl cis-trans isomerase CYP59 [Selaginella moellendorffii]
MAVLVTTSVGDLVIDLDCQSQVAYSFLKLCKIKYYDSCLFHSVQRDFVAQVGDPTGAGSGGDSIFKLLGRDSPAGKSSMKHDDIGMVATPNPNGSQFYIATRGHGLEYLDEKHVVFGKVAEGLDTLEKINEAYVNESFRPYKDIRIKSVAILDDPFDDPEGLYSLKIPPCEQKNVVTTLDDGWNPTIDETKMEIENRAREARSRAVVLEMVGDIPDAEMKPPENVLFARNLNRVTEEEDLGLIFQRFGKVAEASIIRDHKTGESLCYGFIEFANRESCEEAYVKVGGKGGLLIDDRKLGNVLVAFICMPTKRMPTNSLGAHVLEQIQHKNQHGHHVKILLLAAGNMPILVLMVAGKEFHADRLLSVAPPARPAHALTAVGWRPLNDLNLGGCEPSD